MPDRRWATVPENDFIGDSWQSPSTGLLSVMKNRANPGIQLGVGSTVYTVVGYFVFNSVSSTHR